MPAPPTPASALLRRHPAALLIVPTAALLGGQVAAEAVEIAAAVRWTWIALFGAGAAWLFLRREGRWAVLFLSTGTLFLVGYAAYRNALAPRLPPDHLRLRAAAGEALYVEAVHYREPERLLDRTRWYLRAEALWLPHGAEEARGNVLVVLRDERGDWRYGDRVRLWLRLRPPRNPGNPGGFDYERYLARRGIYVTAFLSDDTGVELLARGGGAWSWVERVRREIRSFFERSLPSESAALLKALVVGDMGGISREMRESAVAAGVAHILSISGLHVAMLGAVVFVLVRAAGAASTFVLLRFNLLKIATFASFLAVLLYTLVAGAMVPTVRSAIMIGVYQGAVLLDREDEVFSSLALAALLIGLAWPGVAMEISFQLSFLAVLAIVWGLRRVQKWWPPTRERGLPQERSRLRPLVRRAALYLAVPLLATVGTAPAIAHHFGHLSLAGLLSNPAIVPLVGFLVVPLGLTSGFVSLVSSAAASLVLALAEPLAGLTLALVAFFAALPLASVAVPVPDAAEVALLYLLLLPFVLATRRWQLAAAAAVAVSAAALAVAAWGRPRGELRVTFLSVGQGDAAVVEFPGKATLVVDAGGSPLGDFDPGEAIVAPFLRARKIVRVDYLFVSTPRVDHYGGMRAVVQQFSPSEFWSGGKAAKGWRYRELDDALDRAGVRRISLAAADRCRVIEGVRACVLYSPDNATEDSSVVLRLDYGRASFLFPGDIGKKEEARLVRARELLASTVVKVPRHGSATSSTDPFVAATAPKLAVVSVGDRNPFGFPREEALARYRARGAEVLRTDEDGAITVETDGRTLRYWTFRSKKRGRLSLESEAPAGGRCG